MTNTQQKLQEIIDNFCTAPGMHETPIPGVHCIKFSEANPRTKRHWRACMGIIIQGSKEITLGHEVYRCGEAHYTATPVDLPVISRISSATPEKPFLAILVDLNPLILSQVAAQLEQSPARNAPNLPGAMFVGKASDKMLEATLRLATLFQSPQDALILGPLVIKELLYHLLKSADGPAIHQFVRSGSKMHKMSQAIHRLQSELSQDVDVEALAKAAHMSRSAFFKHFKEVTTMSPIQYQKRLRLLEARRLMIDEGETAERSAYKVGYKSASQFSREYSRMSGNSPLRDATRMKKSLQAQGYGLINTLEYSQKAQT